MMSLKILIFTAFLLLNIIQTINATVDIVQVNGGDELDTVVNEFKYVIALFCEYLCAKFYTWQQFLLVTVSANGHFHCFHIECLCVICVEKYRNSYGPTRSKKHF